jgi:hypothetical protein
MGRLRADIHARDRAVSRGRDSPLLTYLRGANVLRHGRLQQPLRINFTLLPRVEPIELSLHEFHPLLLGNFAVLFRVHQSEQFFHVLVAIAALSGCFGTDAFCAKEVCWSGPPAHMHTIRRVVARRLLCVMSKPPFLKVEPERQLAGAIPSVFGGLLRVQHSKCAGAAYVRCRRGIVCVVQDVREGRFEPQPQILVDRH